MNRQSADLLRLISMLAVLFIHGTAAWESVYYSGSGFSFENSLGMFLNQLARFSVPVFVFLSGFALQKRYSVNFVPREFFSRRFSRIGIPFLVLTVLFLLLRGEFSWSSSTGVAENVSGILGTLLPRIFFYGADYHFYFMIIILQCYLVFPLLRHADSAGLWWGMLVIHLIFISPSHLGFAALELRRPSFPTSFLVYWVFYFYSGILLARREEKIRARLLRLPAAAVAIATAAAFVLVLAEYHLWAESFRATPRASGNFNHFNRMVVVLYSFSVIGLFIRFQAALASFFDRHAEKLNLLTALSFPVYLFHTWVLRGLNLTPLSSEVIVLNLALVVISTLVIAFLNRWISPPWLRLVLGLPEKNS